MHGLKAWVNAVNGIENRRRRIADAYEQLGNYDEALTYVKKFQQAVSDRSVGLLPLARIYASMGKRREAVQALRTTEKNSALAGKEHMLALIYSALGDRDRAIAELEKGVQTRSLMPFVFADPQLDSLRSDSRFQQLLRRAKLPS